MLGDSASYHSVLERSSEGVLHLHCSRPGPVHAQGSLADPRYLSLSPRRTLWARDACPLRDCGERLRATFARLALSARVIQADVRVWIDRL